MRLLVHFKKIGPAAYISHLDLQSAMQRVFRKAGLPIKYSQGFNPHPQTSFAMAAPVGMESLAMYVDIKIEDTERYQISELKKNLSDALPEVLALERIRFANDDYPKLTAAITTAEFIVSFRDIENIQPIFEDYMAQDEIVIQKKGKGGIKPLDIKPFILSYEYLNEDKSVIRLCLKAGSSENLNPMLVGKDVCEKYDLNGFSCIQLSLNAGTWSDPKDLFALDSEVF